MVDMVPEMRKQMAAFMREQGDELTAKFYDVSPDIPLADWAREAVADGANVAEVLALVQNVKDALLLTFYKQGAFDGE